MVKFFRVFSTFLLVILFAACPAGSDKKSEIPQSKEEKWISVLKKEISKTEKELFSDRYIQRTDDVFFLRLLTDVVKNWKKMPTLSDRSSLADKFEVHHEDFELSFPIMGEQRERIQMMMAIVAVGPAYKANLTLGMQRLSEPVLSSLTQLNEDKEIMGAFIDFKSLVESGQIFEKISKFESVDAGTATRELSPRSNPDLLEAAKRIVYLTLTKINSLDLAKFGPNEQVVLKAAKNQMEILSPDTNIQVRTELGEEVQNLVASLPSTHWASLSEMYNDAFRELTRFGILLKDQKLDEKKFFSERDRFLDYFQRFFKTENTELLELSKQMKEQLKLSSVILSSPL